MVIATALAGTALAFSSAGIQAGAQDPEKTVTGHSAGLYQTSGDVLDPEHFDGRETTDIDPDKYLREFNYGRVSTLPDGTTLREFTIIADDRQTMEVSPGVFYNGWTFNGTIPGAHNPGHGRRPCAHLLLQ